MFQTNNAWIPVDYGLSSDLKLAIYTRWLKGERLIYKAIADHDWLLILNTAGHISRVRQSAMNSIPAALTLGISALPVKKRPSQRTCI